MDKNKLKELLKDLERLKLVSSNGEMAGLIYDLTQKLEGAKELEEKFDRVVAEIKSSVPNLDTMFKSVKGNTGEIGPIGPKGDSPTKEELLDLIEPLIPEPINGKDGRTPIHIGKKLPSNPQKGDLWYQD